MNRLLSVGGDARIGRAMGKEMFERASRARSYEMSDWAMLTTMVYAYAAAGR